MIGPRVRIAGRPLRLFHLCGIAGFGAAVGQSLALASRAGLEARVVLALFACAVAVLVLLGMATKIAAGHEALIYYHHEIAVLVVSAALLRGIGRPVPIYLDIVALGLGTFLAFGRLGCLTTGCCYGRPHERGVRYGAAHVSNGFPQCLQGVGVLPVQLMEAACVAAITAAGVIVFWRGARPGEVLAWCVAAYACLRYGLEFLRGDPGRPYWLGSSEAQWTSLLMACAAAWSGFHAWHLWAAMALLACTVWQAFSPRPALFAARHVRQMAELLDSARRQAIERPGVPFVGETPLGVRISASMVAENERDLEVVAFSRTGASLQVPEAERLGKVLTLLLRTGRVEYVSGAAGTYHLVLPAARGAAHAI